MNFVKYFRATNFTADLWWLLSDYHHLLNMMFGIAVDTITFTKWMCSVKKSQEESVTF